MPRPSRFWRNVTLIGLIHIAILAGLMRWSSHAKKPAASEILWMDAGAAVASLAVASPPEATPAESPPAESMREPMPSVPAFQDAADPLMEAESEIQPPRPTPKASVTPKADLRAKP